MDGTYFTTATIELLPTARGAISLAGVDPADMPASCPHPLAHTTRPSCMVLLSKLQRWFPALAKSNRKRWHRSRVEDCTERRHRSI